MAAQRARITAAQGHERLSREDIDVSFSISRELSVAPIAMYAGHALGLLEMTLGRVSEAATALQDVDILRRRMGQGEFNVVPYAAELGEAWAMSGCLREAEELATELTRFGTAQESAWATAAGLRVRALCRPDDYRKLLETALQALPADVAPFDRARTAFILGDRLRRDRHHREARPWLGEAADLFAALDATPWQRRAETLLSGTKRTTRTGIRASALTDRQLEVCQGVAQGRSNREIAMALQLSVKTVEQHLTRVYAKLGIRGRTDLARRAAEGTLGGES